MSNKRITDTLQRIKNDKVLEDHFFKKLSDASEPFEWLVPLKIAGYFDPNKNPRSKETPNGRGYHIPNWNILDTLNNMAEKNEEMQDPEVAKNLLEVVNGIIDYRENGNRIRNYTTDRKLLKIISHFPIEYISAHHIKFIEDALNASLNASLFDYIIGDLFLPKLIKYKAKELIIESLSIILHYRKSEKKFSREYISVIDSYYLKKALDKNKKGISEICPVEAAEVAIKKIQEILKEDESQFNVIWIPAIEDHEQTSFPEDYTCQLVYFVRDMLKTAGPQDIESLVKSLLEEKNDIFKRLGFHVVNSHYNSLSHLLWSIPYNPLNSFTIHELYELFKNNSKSFDNETIKIILDWIESQEFYFSAEVSGDVQKEEYFKAYYKKEWLLALLDSGDEEVKRRYEKYDSINSTEIRHPGFHVWSSGGGFIQFISPIDKDEFKKMTSAEIVEYIKTYKEPNKISFEDSTEINLALSVRGFVSNDPKRYSTGLMPFLSLPRKYQYEFLKGFEEAWRNNKDFDWDELLKFIKELLEDKSFWSEEIKEDGYDYKSWILEVIADLIRGGTKNDKHAFSPQLLPLAEQIILLILERIEFDMSINAEDINRILNSAEGKVFISAINYSLRYARLYCREKEDRWIESMKTDFTYRLNKTKGLGLGFSIVVGMYIWNLYYLDKKWVVDNFNRIFDLNSADHWEAAFTGYLVTTSTIYEEIYKLLRDNGHYEKGLSISFNNELATGKLVQNITIGYLTGWDELTDSNSLLKKLLNTDNPKYLSEIVTFVWSFRDRDDEKVRNKIKPLWKAILEKIKPNLDNDEYCKILSDLGKWLYFIERIDDEVYSWLEISAEFIEKNWNSGFFIEYLNKHVRKTTAKVGKLYMKILETGIYPDYKERDIISIVESLYELDAKEIADRICNIYLQNRFDFLQETFNKNNQMT